MNLPGKQVDSGQQAKRAMTFVLVIPREGRVDAGLGRQIGCRRCDGLDSRLFVVGDDRHSLDGFARLGGSLFQDLDLAVDTREPPPFSAQIRRRDVPDSSAPCAA